MNLLKKLATEGHIGGAEANYGRQIILSTDKFVREERISSAVSLLLATITANSTGTQVKKETTSKEAKTSSGCTTLI